MTARPEPRYLVVCADGHDHLNGYRFDERAAADDSGKRFNGRDLDGFYREHPGHDCHGGPHRVETIR